MRDTPSSTRAGDAPMLFPKSGIESAACDTIKTAMSISNLLKRSNVTVTGNCDSSRTMIFAHGFGTDQTAWSKVAEAFLKDFRVVLYDNVGGGRSDPDAFSPNKYNSLHAYADDLIDICSGLQIENGIMVGHSVSGMIALLAAIKAPQYFSKLVLIGANARYLNEGDYKGGFEQTDLDVLYQAMSTNYQAWASGFSRIAMANPESPQLAESFAKSLSVIRPDIAQSVARVIFQSDYRDQLHKLEKPTLLLQAKEDIAVPIQAAEYLHQHIKGSRLEVIDATGHFPHISAPHAVTAAIQSFL